MNRHYTVTYLIGILLSTIGFAVRLWARTGVDRERRKPMPKSIRRASSVLALISYCLASAAIIPIYAALTGLLTGAFLFVAHKLGRLPPASEWPEEE